MLGSKIWENVSNEGCAGTYESFYRMRTPEGWIIKRESKEEFLRNPEDPKSYEWRTVRENVFYVPDKEGRWRLD